MNFLNLNTVRVSQFETGKAGQELRAATVSDSKTTIIKPMSKIKSIQKTVIPEGWKPKPKETDNDFSLKLCFWKINLTCWLDFIHNSNK